jgi:Flp pilus assembly protein TadG
MSVRFTDYEAVAAAQSDQILGPNGNVGDILERLIITNTIAGTVSIKDGNGTAIPIVIAATPTGTFTVAIGARCVNPTTPGWKVTTTGAGTTVLAVGRFT